jgi:uncharacterized small protein (DUF1192 family)
MYVSKRRLSALEAAARRRPGSQGQAVTGLAAEVRELDRRIAELSEMHTSSDSEEANLLGEMSALCGFDARIGYLESEIARLEGEEHKEERKNHA